VDRKAFPALSSLSQLLVRKPILFRAADASGYFRGVNNEVRLSEPCASAVKQESDIAPRRRRERRGKTLDQEMLRTLRLCGEVRLVALVAELSRDGTLLAKTLKDSALSSVAQDFFTVLGHDGIAESGTISPGDMAESRTGDDEILTVRQVSKLLKLHQRTIYKLAQSGMIPGWRVGKSWRFLKSEIMKPFEKRNV
jgi:excisionase family DNA binding protein